MLFVFGSECFDLLVATNDSNFFLLDAIVPFEMSSVSKSRINEMTDQNQEIMVLTLEEKQTNKTMIIA